MIKYGSQNVDESDRKAVLKALDAEYLTQGPMVQKFEEALANSLCVDGDSVVTCSSGTSALHLGLESILSTSSETQRILCPVVSFVATANSVFMATGMRPEFYDVDESGGMINDQILDRLIKDNEHQALENTILIVVSIGGALPPIDKLRDFKTVTGCRILFDACHAFGSSFDASYFTVCDVITFSFHPIKAITTFEGGAAISAQRTLTDRMRLLRAHGLRYASKNDFPWEYDQISLGYNYRLSDVAASMGISQLKKSDQFIHQRRVQAQRYIDGLIGHPLLSVPTQYLDQKSAFHLFVLRCQDRDLRDELFRYLRDHKVTSALHYKPIVCHSFYGGLSTEILESSFPGAWSYSSNSLSIPIGPHLTEEQQDLIIHLLNEFRG